MVPISFQQDALAVEPADDFQRLLMTFAGKLVEQGTPFHLAREAAQQLRQPLLERRRTKCVSKFFASDEPNGVWLRQNRKGKRESHPVWNNLCVHQRGGWSRSTRFATALTTGLSCPSKTARTTKSGNREPFNSRLQSNNVSLLPCCVTTQLPRLTFHAPCGSSQEATNLAADSSCRTWRSIGQRPTIERISPVTCQRPSGSRTPFDVPIFEKTSEKWS